MHVFEQRKLEMLCLRSEANARAKNASQSHKNDVIA
jgi:hypothetical protein